MAIFAIEPAANPREQPPAAPDLGPVFRHARDAMLALDATTCCIVAWNAAATALLGYGAAEATGRPLASFIPPNHRARDGLAGWLGASAEDASLAAPLELPLLRRDGEQRCVELTFSPLADLAAGPPLILGIARDVTARARAEGALRASAESFATLFGATAEGITVAHDGILLAVNAAFAALMRCAPADLIGRRIADFTPPEYQDRVLGAIRSGDERPYETGVLRPDGSIFFAELIGRSIRYEGRDARLTTFRDITARKAAESALRASEARFAAFMDHSPAVAFIKDEAGRFLYANRTFERRFAIAEADILGKDSAALVPAETARRLHERDAAVLRDGRATEWTEDVPAPDGTVRRWQVYRFPLRAVSGERLLGVMAIDVTERVRAEERLLALHDASVRLAAVRQPRELVPQLLQQAVTLLGAGSGTFYTWDGDAGLLRRTHNWRVPTADTTPDQRPGQGLAGQVFLTRRPLVVNDYVSWAHAMPSGIAGGLRAALAVPLIRAGTILGVVVVRSYDEAFRFDDADVRLLELFGDQAAIALENANLVDTAHRELAERRRTEAHLRASEARFRALAEAAFEAIVISEDGAVREVNPAFTALFGHTAEEAPALTYRDIIAPESRELALAHLRADSETPYEAVGLRRDGSRFPIEVRGRTAILDGRAVRITAVRDIGERKRYEAELARRAVHDPLTDLPNRAYLLEWLGGALANGSVGVLFVDLDGFKDVNDRRGHAEGDRVLIRVARLLQGCVRPGDLVARLGGDEFIVAVPGVSDPRAASAVARRILASFATAGPLAEPGVGVGTSIGIALGAAESPESVLRRADEALYAAKNTGKGRYTTWSPALIPVAS
jgi:diguanylate cyclase (GGDEF)-like protein/PAS domain S-box-containing protein